MMESLSHISPIAPDGHTENTTHISPAPSASQQVDFLVMVGTHHFPFTRLLTWADAFADTHPEVHILVQHGETPCDQFPVRPNLTWAKSLTHDEMDTLRPLAVVLPAGPSLMMEWARRGIKPYIVPRDPQLGEHIDEHQQLFASDMEALGLIASFHDYEALCVALERVLTQGRADTVDASLLTQMGTPSEAAQAFGRLVEGLLR